MKSLEEIETRTAAGIVLAAGMSSRMGRNKLLVEIEGEPLLRRVVRHASEAGLFPLLVVFGHDRENATAILDGLDYTPVVNDAFETGMTSSLRAGVAALPDDVPAAVMILGDMPWVSSEMLSALTRRFLISGAKLVLSDYGSVHAPPTLFGRGLFPEILALNDEHFPRSVTRRHAAEAEVLFWPADRLKDLDRPEDLATLRYPDATA